MGKLALTTQQAKAKQLKRVQLLKSQTQQKASLMNQRQEKANHDEQRSSAAVTRQQQLKLERAQREAQAEVQLLSVLDYVLSGSPKPLQLCSG